MEQSPWEVPVVPTVTWRFVKFIHILAESVSVSAPWTGPQPIAGGSHMVTRDHILTQRVFF